MDTVEQQKSGSDILIENYRNMNETGKKKLQTVSEQLWAIWNTVNGEGKNVSSNYTCPDRQAGYKE